jgi:hypothetical protein
VSAERLQAGYASPLYAHSFSEFGQVLELRHANACLLKRQIGGTGLYDAASCYPLFCCADWTGLAEDLQEIRDQLVSVTVVTDPLGSGTKAAFSAAFNKVLPYKDHFIVETALRPETFVSRSHREQARRALRKVQVDVCRDPAAHLDEWVDLFGVLTERHSISGMRRFSRRAFEEQLSVPGMVMFRATAAGSTVGLDLWYVQDGVAQGHLAAFSEAGYQLRASYATKWELINYFSDRVDFINLGAGRSPDASDGLSQFKRGFSSGTRTSWLCGRVYDAGAYQELVMQIEPDRRNPAYFPAYRAAD